MKKIFTPQQKAAVALEAIKGVKTINQIAGIYEIHPTQIRRWKSVVQENIPLLFSDKNSKESKSDRQLIDELYRTIGQRDIELSWLKKKLQLEP